MITALLIMTIGFIPLVLALNVLRLYKGTKLSLTLLIFMIAITLWQIDIGVLYLKGVLSEELILQLFRFFRIGPTFGVPITFYLIFLIINKHGYNMKNTSNFNLVFKLFNRKVMFLVVLWSTFIYIINWTSLGIEGLRVVNVFNTNLEIYFPIYGQLHFFYIIHSTSFLFFLVIILISIAKGIQNIYLRSFITTFSLCSLLLLITSFFNFIPGTGAIVSSLGVVIFSSIIIFSFVNMNNLMMKNYNRLIERQKKLDYLGDISTSLIHEVKNNLQLIKSYSQMLSQAPSLPKQSAEMVGKIQMASKQLEDLTHSYTEYLNKKSINFKYCDINEIIHEAIEITSEIVKGNRVEVFFEKKYKPIKAYVSDTHLKQVIINLIKNGCEAISSEASERTIHIRTNIVRDQIIIDVTDNGHGIQSVEWERIFDPFITTKNSGMGVGLPFSRKIIFEHRGEIKVHESNSKGTTFRITLSQFSFSDM